MTGQLTTASCTRCDGTGRAIKRVNRRRNGTVSSIIYDLRNDCRSCRGTGLACIAASMTTIQSRHMDGNPIDMVTVDLPFHLRCGETLMAVTEAGMGVVRDELTAGKSFLDERLEMNGHPVDQGKLDVIGHRVLGVGILDCCSRVVDKLRELLCGWAGRKPQFTKLSAQNGMDAGRGHDVELNGKSHVVPFNPDMETNGTDSPKICKDEQTGDPRNG